MAKSKNWVSEDSPSEPCCTRRFADGDAAEWCKHAAPGRYNAVRITNIGSGKLYVSAGPALTGVASATQHCDEIPAGQGVLYSFAGQAQSQPGQTVFSTWGEDGAAHPMRIVFEVVP